LNKERDTKTHKEEDGNVDESGYRFRYHRYIPYPCAFV